jgi:opacity protein-like surface antigen
VHNWRALCVCLIVCAAASCAFAQIPAVPSGNIFIGYSYNRATLNVDGKSNLNGWNGSLEGRIFPFIGLVADLSGYYGNGNVTAACPVAGGSPCLVNLNTKEHNFLFGPRVSFSAGRFRPFAHVLVGVSRITVDGFGSDTSFGSAYGGGLDYKLGGPLHWRFQGDYLQTRFFSNRQNDFRFSTGIVFHF